MMFSALANTKLLLLLLFFIIIIQAQLFALQSDVNTYTEDLGPKDNKFQPWVERNFDLEQVKPEISELLVSNSNVRSLYTQLVSYFDHVYHVIRHSSNGNCRYH